MSFPSEIISWKSKVKGRWVILDTDAIVSFITYQQEYILKELKDISAGLVLIHPVLLELMNTNSPSEKLARTKLLYDHEITELTLDNTILKHAYKLRESLPLDCQPSPTDLYLGGTIGKYSSGNALLLTGNIKDFPYPTYIREGHLLLQNKKSVKTLTFLSLDFMTLVDF